MDLGDAGPEVSDNFLPRRMPFVRDLDVEEEVNQIGYWLGTLSPRGQMDGSAFELVLIEGSRYAATTPKC